MTDCPNGEIRDLLPALLNERLAPAERATVELHMRGCADCQAELALLRRLQSTMRRAPAVDVASIVAAIPAYRAQPVRRGWRGWQAAAAVAVLAVGGASAVVVRQNAADPAASTYAAAPVVAPSTGVSGVAPSAAPVASAPVPVPPVAVGARPTVLASAGTAAPRTASRELAVGGALGDLSDGELRALLEGIESLDGVHSADPDASTPVVPALPVRGAL